MTNQIKKIAKTALLAATLALGGLTGMAASSDTAEARSGIHIDIGGPGFGLIFGSNDFYRDRDRRYRPRRCTPRRALRKSRRMGLRHARIKRVTRRGIIVKARRAYGGRVIAGFGKHRSCPVRFVRHSYR